MLGLGALGQYPLGGGPFGPATITTIGWYVPLSEPVRIKPGLRGQLQQTVAFQPAPSPFVATGWYMPLSEPKRFRVGLNAPNQPVIFLQPTPIVPFGWFEALSEPVRVKQRLPAPLNPFLFEGFPQLSLMGWFMPLSEPIRIKPGLRAQLQQVLAYAPNQTTITPFAWFNPLSEPVRIKLGLRAALQRDLSRGEFVPTSYTARLEVTELGDFIQAVLYQFNVATHAYVDIIEKNPHHLGNMGIIENVAQSSIVASIVEPTTTPTGGSAVPTVAGARVAIILT